jgi:hypothetical protein
VDSATRRCPPGQREGIISPIISSKGAACISGLVIGAWIRTCWVPCRTLFYRLNGPWKLPQISLCLLAKFPGAVSITCSSSYKSILLSSSCASWVDLDILWITLGSVKDQRSYRFRFMRWNSSAPVAS